MSIRIISLFLLAITIVANSQEKIIDKVVAVVGDKYILQSDIENQYLQYKAQMKRVPADFRCQLFEDMLIQKLMVNQAELDSLEVTEGQVDMQLNQRMSVFIDQIGSQEKLEDYFGKSILEIKDDMRKPLREQLQMQMMQSQIIGSIDITPSDVRNYYNNLPKDSLPYVNGTIEIRQLVLYPPYSEQAVYEVRKKLLNLRHRILEGESLRTLAVLYSEGPSATRGGEIGFAGRAELDPEYAKVAFSLKEGQVSKIVKSAYGYHIIQMIEKRGDKVNTRHILMRPKLSPEGEREALNRLDSIATAIKADSITFEKAVRLYSEDEQSKKSGGMAINMQTGNYSWEMDHFTPHDYYIIKDLKVGEISAPFQSVGDNQNELYKIIKIDKKIPPHTANLDQDYNLFKQKARQVKQQEILDKWVANKASETYMVIDEAYKSCNFRQKHWVK